MAADLCPVAVIKYDEDDDVLAYVEKSGSTQPCPMAKEGGIWEILAKALGDLWVPIN
jgi:hypothetical protein